VIKVLPANLNTRTVMTIEKQFALKKDMHLMAFQHKIHELEQDLVARSASELARKRLLRLLLPTT
jgi:hypothetical protein